MKLALRAFGLECDTPVVHRTILSVLTNQRICLESSRIRNNRPPPARHSVQPTQRCYGRGARTLHQVKRVHDNSLYPALLQVNAIYVTHHAQRGIRKESGEV